MSGFPDMMINRCTGETVSGGAIAHTRLCPVHPGAKDELERTADLSDAYHEGFGAGLESAGQDLAKVVAAAEARGYAKAVAALRDGPAFLAWLASGEPQRYYANINARSAEMTAEYLEATKETTDHA